MKIKGLKKKIKVIFYEGIRVKRIKEEKILFELKELICDRYPDALVKFSLTDESGQKVRVEREREVDKIIVGVAIRVKSETWVFNFEITNYFCYGEEENLDLQAEEKKEEVEDANVKLRSTQELTNVSLLVNTVKEEGYEITKNSLKLIKVEEKETNLKVDSIKKRSVKKSTGRGQKQKSLEPEKN